MAGLDREQAETTRQAPQPATAGGDAAVSAGRQRARIALLAILVAGAAALTYSFHDVVHSDAVFTHLYYVPIVLACMWYGRRGIPVALLLGGVLLASHHLFRKDVPLAQDLIRFGLFLLVGFLVAALRDRAARARQGVEEAHSDLMQIFNTGADGCVVLDRDLRVLRINETALRMAGVEEAAAAGARCEALFPDPKCRTDACAVKRVLRGEARVEYESEKRTRNGQRYPCLVTATPFRDAQGTLVGVVEHLKDISQRREAEDRLRRSEDRYRTLFENMRNAVAIYRPIQGGDDFVFEDFNRQAERIERISKRDVVGRHLLDVFPSVGEFGLLDVLRRVWRTGRPEQQPTSFYRDKRIAGWRRNDVYKLPSGELVAIYEDLTEQRKAQEDLQQKSEELEQRVKELDCLNAISKLVERKGTRVGEIFQGMIELIPPALQDPERSGVRVACGNDVYETGTCQKAKWKYTCDLLVHGRQLGYLEVCRTGKERNSDFMPFRAEEKNLLHIIADAMGRLLERNEAEDMLKRSQEQLYQMQKMEALGTLVAGVAHEINNPINMILFNLRLLQKVWRDLEPFLAEESSRNPDRKYGGLTYAFLREHLSQLLDDMEMGSNRVAKTVSNLREFSRKGNLADRKDLSLNTAVRNAIRLAQTTIRKSSVRLELSLEENLPPVEGHLQSLEQIVLNVLINAIQAIDHDHGVLRVTTGAGTEDEDWPYISIADNGTGVDPGIAEAIYDPFVTTKDEEGGMGLGLSITYNLVKAHGGQIAFDTEEGSGTTFTLRFPRGRRTPST